MTLAGVVARLRDKSDHYLPDWARGAMGEAADLLESQAKALSEAEAERDAWRNRESETQESLQAIGDEFGVYGGEPRTHGIRRVLTEMRAFRAEAMKVIERDMEALTEADTQIEYLHDKFKPTGSGANAIARIDIALTAAREGKDMSYQPELGQMMFGQPYKDYHVSNLVDAALCRIRDEIDRVMWNIHQREYASPFANTGNAFKCGAFEVHAYSWADDPQPFNFKWRDIEISWYKYLGRGMSANVELSPGMVAEMLDACLAAVIQYEEVARKESKMPDTQITGPMVYAALDASGHRNTDYNKGWMCDALQAALSGHVVVPREPTFVQMDAAGSLIAEYVRKMKAAGGGVDAMDYALRVVIYRAMIQAAPPVPEMEG